MGPAVLQQLLMKDVITRPLFQEATVIATDKALQRSVNWVHIMEVTNVGQLINGNELILSTGIGWQDDEQICLSFLQQLIDKSAAGLVIELVNYTKTLPESVIQLAKTHDFPLILFKKEVRYIDITQDLHSIFIHEHHQMVKKLEQLSEKLNASLLSGKGRQDLLTILHRFTGLEVMFFPKQGEALFVPPCAKKTKDPLIAQWRTAPEQLINSYPASHIRQIDFLGQTFGYLFVRSKKETELTDFEILSLDRGVTAIAQEVMQSMYYEEQRRRQEDNWVRKWLKGRLTEEAIQSNIKQSIGLTRPSRLLVALCEINMPSYSDTKFFSQLMIARSLFEHSGFQLVVSRLHHQTVFLLFPPESLTQLESIHKEIIKIFTQLKHTQELGLDTYAIGQLVCQLTDANKSYKSAQTVLHVQHRVGQLPIPAFEHLHSYQLIVHMEESGTLEDYIHQYLGTLLHMDKKKREPLLRTLKYYLMNNGKKKETAEALYIVRQTLYHRLEKIEEAIGNIFSTQEKRIALELALIGYEYLYGGLHQQWERNHR
ncbi:PucR family transcriptional regulator [Bacillus sp. REN10]|uniref:PucR family transcriptional regulator n=1 Tax=Bacillus sp. REN10 TaxID=2782541 RepID=UPI00193B7C8F|nr:PucR family transcriptional regulator [Bacillus sp. REN10]